MEQIVDPILCIFTFIGIIYYSYNITVFFVDIENQTAFIQFIDIYTFLTLYIKVSCILEDL